MVTPAKDETVRPQGPAVPAPHELWAWLQRVNKASLARRFPGWTPPTPSAAR